MGRAMFVGKPDSVLRARATRPLAPRLASRTIPHGIEQDRSSDRLRTATRRIVMVAGIAVVIRELSRRVDRPIHLPASARKIDLRARSGTDGLTLFSAPDAIDDLDSTDIAATASPDAWSEHRRREQSISIAIWGRGSAPFHAGVDMDASLFPLISTCECRLRLSRG